MLIQKIGKINLLLFISRSILIIREKIKENVMELYGDRRNGNPILKHFLNKYRMDFHKMENKMRKNLKDELKINRIEK